MIFAMKEYSKLNFYIVISIAMDARCYLAPKTTLSLQSKLERFYIERRKQKKKKEGNRGLPHFPLSFSWPQYVLVKLPTGPW